MSRLSEFNKAQRQRQRRRDKLIALQTRLGELERIAVLPGYEQKIKQEKRNLKRRITRLQGSN